jgi:hypothetical protein
MTGFYFIINIENEKTVKNESYFIVKSEDWKIGNYFGRSKYIKYLFIVTILYRLHTW